jgi:type IV fimbrial biogenesis protein FimT
VLVTMSAASAPRRRTRHGLTLIELLVVLTIVGVLTGIAIPGLGAFVAGQRVSSMALDLNTDLLFARSEALKRNAAVSVTPREGGWGAGWVVASGGTELLTREASAGSLNFGDAPAAITFGAQGRVSAPAAAVRITVSSSGHTITRRCVELDLSGRARTKPAACPS